MVQLGQNIVAAKSTSSDLAMLDGSLMSVPSQLRLFVVLLAGASWYTDRKLHLSLDRQNRKNRAPPKQHYSQKAIVRGKIIQLGCSAYFLGESVNWSWNFPKASLLKVRVNP